jgi:NADPH:quinone reductase-like Zn-dependent oxidoreductase
MTQAIGLALRHVDFELGQLARKDRSFVPAFMRVSSNRYRREFIRSAHMKALIATAYGDVENLTLAEMPEPKLGPGDVKIQVHAASINPLDWKMLSGQMRASMELHFPAILGHDASGEVLEVGADVKSLRAGDRVLGLASNTFAERVAAAENAWVTVPRGLELKDAAALPQVALTGALLADAVDPRPGLSILVTGALGGVGRIAVFVAKRAGATVWAGVRAKQKAAAGMLGADHVVAIDDDAETAELPEFDAICDTVGGEPVARLLPHLKRDGALGSALGEPAAAKERGARVTAIRTFTAIRTQPDLLKRWLSDLATAAARRKLVMPTQRTFPLKQGAEAFRLARQGSVGKVLLLP